MTCFIVETEIRGLRDTPRSPVPSSPHRRIEMPAVVEILRDLPQHLVHLPQNFCVGRTIAARLPDVAGHKTVHASQETINSFHACFGQSISRSGGAANNANIRAVSAPCCSATPAASTTLPFDFDIFAPFRHHHALREQLANGLGIRDEPLSRITFVQNRE